MAKISSPLYGVEPDLPLISYVNHSIEEGTRMRREQQEVRKQFREVCKTLGVKGVYADLRKKEDAQKLLEKLQPHVPDMKLVIREYAYLSL